ncbi:thioredoxin-disulfide reductase [Mycoplasmoides pneumoniae]|uniref:Thioredoxin reductase n=1 Tax=Mycoplasma pneumoniae (strain ATCC 29342 / M129 / Subtype 1) TaxID=272634 RepID=TRXB_MYCPN|nr:thioredoxin-disulfide reductase [Mycoplasmoides pneumoniae]P75531.1 RecName: Full=Thioredoxin reductase; Short=TRXR [Mycoplasmoides pneumoniae M129]AAB96239.1 thioredoxin reductase [Mycoplasmoides pneumoniae M129]AAC45451.1 thioredoxin reductase K04_orf315 [Mycoplasmoides pneumoniae]AGC04165.1 thioredoxin reductase [Mycoplasmoides pneumoniae M129-B7]ALA30123.1 thioredoxin reductase [Mycoplasmoides pneumoniae PI 1428]ALA32233.1 thioredoxin reductase [Mycoplasmoides pneumoniae 51494]
MLKVKSDFLTKDQVIYDVAIVGAGPAGIAAGIYGKRANLNLAIIEGSTPGGKVVKTNIVENYPGYKSITGPDLGLEMYNHLIDLEPTFFYANLIKLDKAADTFILYLDDKTVVFAKTVIYATGMLERKLGVAKEDHFYGKGISYCAICDGSLYKDQVVGVVGGGNSAIQEALYLASMAKTVHLIHRREGFRADETALNKLRNLPNVVFHLNYTVKELLGNNTLNGIVLQNTLDHSTKQIDLNCVFPYIGFESITKPVEHLNLKLDPQGFLITNEQMETSLKGLFAAGDCRSKHFRQIGTAINDGIIAVLTIRDVL